MQQNFIGSYNWIEYLPQMQIMFDQLNDAVYIVDREGKILALNQSAAKLSGYDLSEMIGKPVEGFIFKHPNIGQTEIARIGPTQAINDTSTTKSFPKYLAEMVAKDGHRVVVEVTHIHFDDSIQNISCIIARNISNQILSETLREINSTLSSSLKQEEIFDLLLVELRKLIPYDGGNFMLVNDKTANVTRTLGYETFEEKLPGLVNSLKFDIESTENIKKLITDQKPIILQDTRVVPYWQHNQASDFFRSWIGVPIIIENKVTAIISLDKVEPNFFTEEHAFILTLFANQAASAIKNAKFFSTVKKSAERFMSLYSLSQIINTNIRSEDIYPSIYQVVSELMLTEFFCISLYDAVAQTVTDVYMMDNGEPQVLTTRPLEKGLFSTVLKTGKSLLYHSFDAATAKEVGAVMVGDMSTSELSQSILVVPLKIGSKSIGIITTQSYKPNMYTKSDRETLELLAANVAIAIENARLFDKVQELAITDPLTQIYNRRKFEESATKEFDRSLRYSRPLCAIMIDLDLFKEVNDSYGHIIGDQVLASLASLCKKNLRNIDILARYGGEEFVILLPETTAIQGLLTAERLREECKDLKVESAQGPISLTISLGLAELNKSCKTLEELIDRADQALYESKRLGRNKSTIWTFHLKTRSHPK